jgi:hypothetical protein
MAQAYRNAMVLDLSDIADISCLGRITKSVFRMAARLTELWAKAPQLETAPVCEKRSSLSDPTG